MNWEEWVQQMAGKASDAFIAKKVTQPYELKKMQLQAFSDYGYYSEGQPGVNGMPMQYNGTRNLVMLGAGALLLFMLVKD
ncbi:hypothetical protein [Nitrosovibrio sp. Nv4]|uniref:hypothetical protein n=1 Tax=Nitrosovibrio sp. Nv4 TaxID=1945880 RepID=UPI000BCF128C|nr:hypothetical protein [Nitrosovibrio sp. Nv4]SOD41609.1 hypothetical protein SAMN06298226_1911 [Nitrosovibrio sp. Nv4]